MRKPTVLFFVIILLTGAGLAFFGRYTAGRAVRDAALRVWSKPASLIVAAEGRLRHWMLAVYRFRVLESDYLLLKQENAGLMAELSRLRAADEQDEFLRQAFSLVETSVLPPIPAGIFDVSVSPVGYTAVLNRGNNDGVVVGGIVTSADGVLVGVVDEVLANNAKVLLINDPRFSATAKISGTPTSGIIKGNGSDDLRFEMIVRDDQISEGDVIVTSGDDMFPAGLLIGTVALVEENDADVFKNVVVRAFSGNTRFGKVLVIAR